MKLLEYQAKEVLASLGIAIPRGMVARTPDEAAAAASKLGAVAVKAQVPVGGRGKAGGIKLARTAGEARAAAQQITHGAGLSTSSLPSSSTTRVSASWPARSWR